MSTDWIEQQMLHRGGLPISTTVSEAVDINAPLDREAIKARRVGWRPVRVRQVVEREKTYTAWDAHSLLEGDHEGGRPGHFYE